jgi:hypothetical protein
LQHEDASHECTGVGTEQAKGKHQDEFRVIHKNDDNNRIMMMNIYPKRK